MFYLSLFYFIIQFTGRNIEKYGYNNKYSIHLTTKHNLCQQLNVNGKKNERYKCLKNINMYIYTHTILSPNLSL